MTIIAILALLVGIGNTYFIWKLYKQSNASVTQMKGAVGELLMDNKLYAAFEEKDLAKNIETLALVVFRKVKERFHLKAESYAEVVQEIDKSRDVPEDIRELLIDFFNEMIRITYRDEAELSHDEKVDLRKKIKVILKAVQHI